MDAAHFAVLLLPAALLFVSPIWKAIVNNYKLRSIPTVGCSGLLTSYIGARRFTSHARELVEEGYKKYRGSVFKVPMMSGWAIVVSGPGMVEDIKAAGDDMLSVTEAFNQVFHIDATLPSEADEDRLSLKVVKLPLTKNIGIKFPEVQDEVVAAFNDHIPGKGNDWVPVRAYSTVMDIVCRTSNRMLVGLPLCRDPDYLELNKNFTLHLANAARTINRFPLFLKFLVARLNREIPKGVKRGIKHLGPLFRGRVEQEARHGKDWSEKPNDAVKWLLDCSRKDNPDIDLLSTSVLSLNFAAIHTTTNAFTHVLYDLAVHPEYVQAMRDEVETIIREEGWSKETMGKLWKVDSFIRESLRVSGSGALSVPRRTLKDFTFSNGITIPAGNLVMVPLNATHIDQEYYTDADTFDGFRFAKLRDQEGMENRHQIVTVDPNFLTFGQGRHACPGRFFVANELKAMLAHVLLHYDVKLADGQTRPKNLTFGLSVLPNPTAQVLFRKRMST